jgi:hypothetical protein
MIKGLERLIKSKEEMIIIAIGTLQHLFWLSFNFYIDAHYKEVKIASDEAMKAEVNDGLRKDTKKNDVLITSYEENFILT